MGFISILNFLFDKNMRKLLFYMIMMATKPFYAQVANIDTIVFEYEKFKSIRQLNWQNQHLSLKNETYFLKKMSLSFCLTDSNNLMYSERVLFTENTHVVVVFRRNNFIYKIEEGKWNKSGFAGHYCSYFKNGSIKSEGVLRQDLEVGKWVYYKKDGSVFKVINYPEIINGELPNKKPIYKIKTAISLYSYPTPQDSINFVKSVKSRWLRRYR